MALERGQVHLRSSGLLTLDVEELVRFGTLEPHQVIRSSLANCDRYGPALRTLGRPPDLAVLACSTFVAAAGYGIPDLAAGTGYTSYHALALPDLRNLPGKHRHSYELWPTATIGGRPDPRDPVHFDLVIAVLPLAEVAARTGSPEQRRELRRKLLPRFVPLLAAFQGPYPIPSD